jgi:hypothetical protein
MYCCRDVQVDKGRVKVWYSREANTDFDNLRPESRVFVDNDAAVASALRTAKAWVVQEVPTEEAEVAKVALAVTGHQGTAAAVIDKRALPQGGGPLLPLLVSHLGPSCISHRSLQNVVKKCNPSGMFQ